MFASANRAIVPTVLSSGGFIFGLFFIVCDFFLDAVDFAFWNVAAERVEHVALVVTLGLNAGDAGAARTDAVRSELLGEPEVVDRFF